MIYLKHFVFFEPLNIPRNTITNIVIKSKSQYWNMLLDINNTFNDTRLEVFDIYDKTLITSVLKKAAFISDYLNYDYNVRKVKNELYKKLETDARENGINASLQYINDKINLLFKEINHLSSFDLEYNRELELSNLFKLVDLKITEQRNDFLTNLTSILKLNLEFLNSEIIVLQDCLIYLNDEELGEFIKFLNYNKLTVINISPHSNYSQNLMLNTVIVDNDRCVY